jgi:hypothetical protein
MLVPELFKLWHGMQPEIFLKATPMQLAMQERGHAFVMHQLWDLKGGNGIFPSPYCPVGFDRIRLRGLAFPFTM